MACKLNENGKQMRGFAVIGLAARKRIAAMGGRKTAKKLGKAHMSRIGRNGRRKRMLAERKAKKAALANSADTREHPSRWV